MQLSKTKLNKLVEKQMLAMFSQTIADFQKPEEAEIFLRDFLSKTERISLAKRLITAFFLEKGQSYSFIKKKIKVSSATIANIDKTMRKKSQGFILAFQKIEAEKWASQTTKKIKTFVKNIIGEKKKSD